MASGFRFVRHAALRLRRRPLLLLPAAGLLVVILVLVAALAGPGRAFTPTRSGEIAAVPKQPSPSGRAPSSPGAAHASPSPRRPSPPSPAPSPASILATHNGPFASSTFEVQNAWHGAPGSREVWVYAGTALSPGGTRTVTAPGVRVYVQIHDGAEPYSLFQGSYAAPGADSALTITGFTGNVLTLRTEGGKVYRFDVVARRFL